jgi:hypothetical protein
MASVGQCKFCPEVLRKSLVLTGMYRSVWNTLLGGDFTMDIQFFIKTMAIAAPNV